MNTKPTLALRIIYYQLLLQRYATRLIHDAAVATILVQQALDAQYAIDGLAPTARLRQLLKTDVCNRCFYWKQSKIFNRPPDKVPLPKHKPSSLHHITKGRLVK